MSNMPVCDVVGIAPDPLFAEYGIFGVVDWRTLRGRGCPPRPPPRTCSEYCATLSRGLRRPAAGSGVRVSAMRYPAFLVSISAKFFWFWCDMPPMLRPKT
jgi:hypothetical protein